MTIHDNSELADAKHMARALLLAERGAGNVAPNPMVGAVVVLDGQVVGEGWHATYGREHAEVVALSGAGERANGATLYVTLEPCNHTGKTAPCVQAIIAAGIKRVVFAIDDPNPVATGGVAALRAAGIETESGVLAEEASELNQPFLFASRGATRPWVTLKLALSLDGAVVDASRERGWLTGPDAQRAVHFMRARADAIGIGIGTALADDPLLTVREAPAPRVPPTRVVFDRAARLPVDSQLVRGAGENPLIVLASGQSPSREGALAALGVDVIRVKDIEDGLVELRERGIRHLLVEGGAVVASALMSAGLVDRLIIFQAPVILGRDAINAFSGVAPQRAQLAPRLRVVSRQAFGDDLMTTYAVSTG
ncbi:MAG: bifunctional diaminohydroxyphosphoribosylaminopyrimidine deaminase/5-amino-6-(5-phosphoribosylamino)uracil reductase RibD [Phycisphaerae bacterium]|nr:bifunctional diaminohydroxyphosphoribosylaminopyrimidine deaminase/5-amino-6-(5-phosphoribosylamino)uracil reductase RibD [Gemmatimonadaceae bacterium]